MNIASLPKQFLWHHGTVNWLSGVCATWLNFFPPRELLIRKVIQTGISIMKIS